MSSYRHGNLLLVCALVVAAFSLAPSGPLLPDHMGLGRIFACVRNRQTACKARHLNTYSGQGKPPRLGLSAPSEAAMTSRARVSRESPRRFSSTSESRDSCS